MAKLQDAVPTDLFQSCSYEDALSISNWIIRLDSDPVTYVLELTDQPQGGNRTMGNFKRSCPQRRTVRDNEVLSFNCGMTLSEKNRNPNAARQSVIQAINDHIANPE